MNDWQPAEEEERDELLGRTSATQWSRNTVDTFGFWLYPDRLLAPFDIVTAAQMRGTRTIGMVTRIETETDAASHLANTMVTQGGVVDWLADAPVVQRLETTVAYAHVLANTGFVTAERSNPLPVTMPVLNDRPVRFATGEEITFALGMPNMARPIPAGIIEMTNGQTLPVAVDGAFLLGPEGAHVHICGVSGLACKSSFLMFLLQSTLQTLVEEEVACILVNVKQADLLSIDQPPLTGDLSRRDLDLYKMMGLLPRPFENVRYYLPRGSRGHPNSYAVPENAQIYAYSFGDVANSLDLLFNQVDDSQHTMASIIQEIREQRERPVDNPFKHITTWADLREFDSYSNEIRPSSRGRFRRLLGELVGGNPLFPEGRDRNTAYLGDVVRNLHGGQVVVIDIAGLNDLDEQGFVVGDLMRNVEQLYRERRHDRPKRLIILVDELNRYAPRGDGGGAVAGQVADIARTGRSRGTILFTAAQLRSMVSPQVVENCATHVIGRCGAAELTAPAYGFIDHDTKQSITQLNKGELVLVHQPFRQPVKVVFPKPAFRRQETT